MGGSHNNIARLCKKGLKRGGVYNNKYNTLNLNVTTYNGLENKYQCSNFDLAPTTKKNKKQKKKITQLLIKDAQDNSWQYLKT